MILSTRKKIKRAVLLTTLFYGLSFLNLSPVSAIQIQDKYQNIGGEKVKILLVPGHDLKSGGAEIDGLKEREIVVKVAEALNQLLEDDHRIKVVQIRDSEKWNPDFKKYLSSRNVKKVVGWIEASKKKFNSKKVNREIFDNVVVYHNTVNTRTRDRLYAINKFANDNNFDLVLNLHFNDYPNRIVGEEKYRGFAIYIPDQAYKNSANSEAIAKSVFNSLLKVNTVSNLPGENTGVVYDPELIAVGAYNTLKAPSLLIEYAYLHELLNLTETEWEEKITALAVATYEGLQNFLQSK